MRYYYLFIFLIILASCSKRIITTTTKTVEKDSVHVDTVKTKKVVKTKGDSIGIKFNLSELTQSPTTAENPKLEQPVTFADDPVVFHKQVKTGHLTEIIDITKKGNVQISCKEDSLQHVIDNLKITIQKFKTTTTITQSTKIAHKPTQFDLFCRGFTIAIFIVIVLLVLNKFKKFIPWIP